MARQIAHEIKNPLTPIRLSTQFMQRAHGAGSPDFDQIFEESTETIIHQVDVLKRIAGEFSSFGKMQQLDIKSIPIIHLVNEIVTPYRSNTSGVEITTDYDCDNIKISADAEAVRKICANLIENAMEAMSDGGTLLIGCRLVNSEGEALVKVSFRDSGPGLGEEVQGKLFEPYFSTKTTGTGLGLAICRTLSREMGGEVTVENVTDGTGVEAAIYLKTDQAK
jgi:nitrogen fixation/metabolism regulation signal transduction histidine kinase